jgi:hypothetical protein
MEKSDGGSTKYWSHGGRGTGFYSGSEKTKSITRLKSNRGFIVKIQMAIFKTS